MLSIVVMLVSTFAVAFGLIPVIIDVSKLKRLFDEPLEYRKIHFTKTPNLGGVAIFTAILLGTAVLINPAQLTYLTVFIAASFIIAIVGVKDDLVGIAPGKKLSAQIAAALIMAWFGNIRITSFHGFLGINELILPVSLFVTVLVIVFISNALNLLDGIDCLAGGIGLVASITYAFCFYQMGDMGDCLLAVATAGALTGFLYYNISPAKIFMGDSGSLLIGFILAIISIRFIELNKLTVSNPYPIFSATPAIAISILIIPFYDTLRVFFLRIMNRKSPFSADKNHLHHWLVVSLNLSHIQASLLLVVTNIAIMFFAFYFQQIGSTKLVSLLLVTVASLNILIWKVKKTNAKVVGITSYENITNKPVVSISKKQTV